jgi:ClpP class serine protease
MKKSKNQDVGQVEALLETKAPTQKGPSKTPAFQALHAARYRRQDLIKAIEAETGRQLVCYVGGIDTEISRDDILFFSDVLHNLKSNEDLDLLLHTPGGDMDAAEKLIEMVRKVVGNAVLRVVIPDFAKSSGTLMALGADYIVMSDSSELGPIDPQIVMQDSNGLNVVTPVQSYLDAYESHANAVNINSSDIAAQLMLQKFDPARLQRFRAVKDRARVIAEKQLKYGMFGKDRTGNYTKIADTLLDTRRYLSHAQVIGPDEAMDIGLFVEYREPTDETWRRYWQLYCYQRLEIREKDKLYESSYASLNFSNAS